MDTTSRAAIALYALAAGVENAHRMLRLDLRTLMGVGLLFAIVAGVFGLLTGGPILTGLWYSQPIPVVGKVGTPLLFDVGVYLVVLGVILKILFTLMTAPEVAQQPVSIKGLVATNVHETAQDETPHAVRDDRWR